MTELEKIFLRFEGCSEEKIEQIEREKDYFLLEGPEPYYFMQGYKIAERKYIEQIEKMKCCGNCKHLKENHSENCIFINSLNTIVCNKWELAE